MATRREFLQLTGLSIASLLLPSCGSKPDTQEPTTQQPQIIKNPETGVINEFYGSERRLIIHIPASTLLSTFEQQTEMSNIVYLNNNSIILRTNICKAADTLQDQSYGDSVYAETITYDNIKQQKIDLIRGVADPGLNKSEYQIEVSWNDEHHFTSFKLNGLNIDFDIPSPNA